MVHTTVYLSDRTNHILKMVKAINNLSSKDDAIEFIAERYAEFFPELLEKVEK